MTTEELKAAYKWHKQNPRGARLNATDGTLCGAAMVALVKARRDAAEGKRRYPSSKPNVQPWPAVSWQPGRPHIGYVDDPARIGLREVGRVNAEADSRNLWNRRADETGWYTDPFGDVFKDGTGLCWGVVYQLAGRDGKARFVAGYQMGGTDGGPTLDFGNIYESTESDAWTRVTELKAAREAAYAADSMANPFGNAEATWNAAWSGTPPR